MEVSEKDRTSFGQSFPCVYNWDLVFQQDWIIKSSRTQHRGFTNLKLNMDLWNQWINIWLLICWQTFWYDPLWPIHWDSAGLKRGKQDIVAGWAKISLKINVQLEVSQTNTKGESKWDVINWVIKRYLSVPYNCVYRAEKYVILDSNDITGLCIK